MALQFLLSLGDKYAPLLTSSRFKETGMLTPDEFVIAGEQLVRSCGTWQWASGDPRSQRDYLPSDKQYLVTQSVPCAARAGAFSVSEEVVKVEGDNDDWILATDAGGARASEIADAADLLEPPQPAAAAAAAAVQDDDDEVLDADEYLETVQRKGPRGGAAVQDDDDAELTMAPVRATGAAVTRMRRYDISITYDNWYKTPRVWLNGLDEDGHPLSPQQVLEDVSSDHAEKTATIEPHPHTGAPSLSIHPCQHAHVMKRFIDAYEASGTQLRVDQYMFLFIKFIASVIPTIEYDFTVDVENVSLE